jgi:hypothetical protein
MLKRLIPALLLAATVPLWADGDCDSTKKGVPKQPLAPLKCPKKTPAPAPAPGPSPVPAEKHGTERSETEPGFGRKALDPMYNDASASMPGSEVPAIHAEPMSDPIG